MSRKTLSFTPGFILRCAIFVVLSLPPLCLVWYPLIWAFYARSYQQDSDRPTNQQKFSRNNPFFRYGRLITEHTFTFRALNSRDEIETRVHDLVENIARSLHIPGRMSEPDIRSVSITDVAITNSPYEKAFVEYSAETPLKSRVSILFGVSVMDETVFVRQWALMRGPIEAWNALAAGFVAPFTVLDWGIRQVQGLYSIKAALSADSVHDYDAMDVDAWLSSFHAHFLSDLTQQMTEAGFAVENDMTQSSETLPPSIDPFTDSPDDTTRQTQEIVQPFVDTQPDMFDTQPSRKAFAKKLAAQVSVSQAPTEILEPEVSEKVLDDTVEMPQLRLESAIEIEDEIPPHLSDLKRMLKHHIEDLHGHTRHQAKTIIDELIVELKTGDEISIKILTALLEELRMVLGDIALRDTLEILTNPRGQFNDIVQEITGDLLANLADEMILKAKKQELNDTLTQHANTLESINRSAARLAIFSLMHMIDTPEAKNYDGIFRELHQCVGTEMVTYVLHMLAADDHHFPAAAQLQAQQMLEVDLKKHSLRDELIMRARHLDPVKKDKAFEAIDRLMMALEYPDPSDYKTLFREIGLRLGRHAYESLLRKLAADDTDFPLAHPQARHDLDLYERAQQRSVN